MSYSEFTKLHTSNKCTHNDSDGTELKLASHFEQVRKFAKQFSEADFAELRKKATELSTKGLDAWEPPVAGRKPWRRYSRQPRATLLRTTEYRDLRFLRWDDFQCFTAFHFITR